MTTPRTMSTLAPRPAPAASPALPTPPEPFAIGDRVRWTEGRTRRVREGVVQAATLFAGLEEATEYDVQVVTKKGLGRISRLFQSQLERVP